MGVPPSKGNFEVGRITPRIGNIRVNSQKHLNRQRDQKMISGTLQLGVNVKDKKLQ